MELISRIALALGALKGRLKIGGLQGALIYNLHNSGLEAPRTQQLISEITHQAWAIRIIANFFQHFGFSFEDYLAMYAAAVRACPNRLLNNRNLVATFLLIDEYSQFSAAFLAYSRAVADQAGDARIDGLATLIALMVNDIVQVKEKNLSAIENFPP